MLNNYAFTYKINDRDVSLEALSKYFKRGKNEITFKKPFFKDEEMIESGVIIRRFSQEWFSNIKEAITSFIAYQLKNNNVDTTNFTLDKYHKYVNNNIHAKIVSSFRGGALGIGGIHLDKLGIPYKELDSFINSEVNSTSKLSCVCHRLLVPIKLFWIRIVRPNITDNNPPHKDTHVGRIQKCINIYLPLAGSDHNSSLPLIPKTHIENESEYIISDSPCFINNKRYTVPAVVHRNNGLNMITPNPRQGEVMIFTPHLIHGGGANHNNDTTRVSLEMRFFE